MAYNKFTLSLVKERFKIENQIISFLPESLSHFMVSTQLAQELIEVEGIGLFSEKSKSEHIIIPVLKELRRKNKDKFSYFSGYEFNVDKKLSLNGFCDFIFSMNKGLQQACVCIFYIQGVNVFIINGGIFIRVGIEENVLVSNSGLY